VKKGDTMLKSAKGWYRLMHIPSKNRVKFFLAAPVQKNLPDNIQPHRVHDSYQNIILK
jgi:hypothetical protein